jgi:hypothetical protein
MDDLFSPDAIVFNQVVFVPMVRIRPGDSFTLEELRLYKHVQGIITDLSVNG